MKNAHKNFNQKKPERPNHRRKDNIKIDLSEIRHNDVDRIRLAQEIRVKVAVCCEHVNGLFGFWSL
jgi:hypothetical protein